jgi:hypothetical protein
VHRVHADFDLWRQPPYEYEAKHMPIDILSGHDGLRKWVADAKPATDEWHESLLVDEKAWEKERADCLLY